MGASAIALKLQGATACEVHGKSTAGFMRARTISISAAPRKSARRWMLGLLAVAGSALYVGHSHAATGMCAEGLYCGDRASDYSSDDRYFRFSTAFSSAT